MYPFLTPFCTPRQTGFGIRAAFGSGTRLTFAASYSRY